ncbi:unnamed protein product [Vicia faba]|uniref:Uncharacterized protein n=1 Tax=Vicia faba TaxID=3906 RepID=A0AAV1AVD4_VICFA|nr:unnamed protein product [Vicia faba]
MQSCEIWNKCEILVQIKDEDCYWRIGDEDDAVTDVQTLKMIKEPMHILEFFGLAHSYYRQIPLQIIKTLHLLVKQQQQVSTTNFLGHVANLPSSCLGSAGWKAWSRDMKPIAEETLYMVESKFDKEFGGCKNGIMKS